MGREKFTLPKTFMCCANVMFLMTGFVLMSLGGLLLADNERVLLSRLLGPGDINPDQPLFYYLAFVIAGLGFIIAIDGILGCWAVYTLNRYATIFYVLIVILLVLGKCTVYIVAVFWPHLLGFDVRPARLIRALQRSYSVPGSEQFTAAFDLAQTKFGCCGINGSNNYGTSWWRLQEVGRRELVVPLSCCNLYNRNETDSFLNPEPANLTLCQALNPAEHQYARYTGGCLELIEKWAQEQTIILFIIGSIILLIEVSVLFSTFFTVSSIGKRRKSESSTFTSTQTLSPFGENDHDFDMEHRMHTRNTSSDTKS